MATYSSAVTRQINAPVSTATTTASSYSVEVIANPTGLTFLKLIGYRGPSTSNSTSSISFKLEDPANPGNYVILQNFAAPALTSSDTFTADATRINIIALASSMTSTGMVDFRFQTGASGEQMPVFVLRPGIKAIWSIVNAVPGFNYSAIYSVSYEI